MRLAITSGIQEEMHSNLSVKSSLCDFFSRAWLILSCFAYLLAFCPGVFAAEADAGLNFTILHTNDLHSHEQPFQDHGKIVGGMPEMIELMNKLRRENANNLTIDAGDIFEGTPFFTYYHGDVEVKMLNEGAYDIYTIGNHEFDDGPESLAKQLQQAKFDVINCNIDASAYPALAKLIKPSVVKEIDGQKVAFIGAICPDLNKVTYHADKVKVINADGDWMSPIRDEIARVKAQGINKIILVTHVGVDRDKLLAKLPDVDVIVGGHSHTRLEKAIVVDHEDGSHCVVVQTGSYGRAIGKLDLHFTSEGVVDLTHLDYKLIDITAGLPANAKAAAYLDEKEKPFSALVHEMLAVSTKRFDNIWQSYPGDSPLGDLVTDAFAEGGAKYGATIALENRGGMRTALEEGPISGEAVEELLPFANTLNICTVTGDELRKVLEMSVGGSPERSVTLGAQFLDVHGIKFEWDPKAEKLNRVRKIWTVDADNKTELLKPEGHYRVAINDYAFSTEGFDFSHATDVVNTGKRLSYYLREYLLNHKTVSPQPAGRIIPLSAL